jgi:hypothetical protein
MLTINKVKKKNKSKRIDMKHPTTLQKCGPVD